jgi:hypothetical protein
MSGADLADDIPTVTRMPRMQALPPIVPGSCVMRSNRSIAI